jgi:HTH-type transcriptional regulator/antitoxin HigA
MMDVRPLHNEQDYDWAIHEITRYFETEPAHRTADGDRFEVLSILIKAYEDKHFAIPDVVQVIG